MMAPAATVAHGAANYHHGYPAAKPISARIRTQSLDSEMALLPSSLWMLWETEGLPADVGVVAGSREQPPIIALDAAAVEVGVAVVSEEWSRLGVAHHSYPALARTTH